MSYYKHTYFIIYNTSAKRALIDCVHCVLRIIYTCTIIIIIIIYARVTLICSVAQVTGPPYLEQLITPRENIIIIIYLEKMNKHIHNNILYTRTPPHSFVILFIILLLVCVLMSFIIHVCTCPRFGGIIINRIHLYALTRYFHSF